MLLEPGSKSPVLALFTSMAQRLILLSSQDQEKVSKEQTTSCHRDWLIISLSDPKIVINFVNFGVVNSSASSTSDFKYVTFVNSVVTFYGGNVSTTFQNCKFLITDNSSLSCIHTNSLAEAVIAVTDSEFNGCGSGVYASGTVKNCIFNNTQIGVYLTRPALAKGVAAFISQNTFNNSWAGILVETPTNANVKLGSKNSFGNLTYTVCCFSCSTFFSSSWGIESNDAPWVLGISCSLIQQ